MEMPDVIQIFYTGKSHNIIKHNCALIHVFSDTLISPTYLICFVFVSEINHEMQHISEIRHVHV